MALSALQLSVRGPLTTHAGGGVARERAPLPTARGSAGLPSLGGERGAGWVKNESLRDSGLGWQRAARGAGGGESAEGGAATSTTEPLHTVVGFTLDVM